MPLVRFPRLLRAPSVHLVSGWLVLLCDSQCPACSLQYDTLVLHFEGDPKIVQTVVFDAPVLAIIEVNSTIVILDDPSALPSKYHGATFKAEDGTMIKCDKVGQINDELVDDMTSPEVGTFSEAVTICYEGSGSAAPEVVWIPKSANVKPLSLLDAPRTQSKQCTFTGVKDKVAGTRRCLNKTRNRPVGDTVLCWRHLSTP